jgi:hypothetical protein
MRAGGTCDLPALNEDLNQITDGNYSSIALITLPLLFSNGDISPLFGARMDLGTPSGSNPILGQISPTRVTLLQPANSITLITDAIDENGNYVASYPFSSIDNYQRQGDSIQGFMWLDNGNSLNWAKGFIRLNGVGMWLPMSLMPYSGLGTGDSQLNISNTSTQGFFAPWAGFSSVAGPISFFDWIGAWDGVGSTDNSLDPNATIPNLLAMAAINLNASSIGTGDLVSYAVPNSSGRQPGQSSANQAQKQRDILVRAGNGKKGCP